MDTTSAPLKKKLPKSVLAQQAIESGTRKLKLGEYVAFRKKTGTKVRWYRAKIASKARIDGKYDLVYEKAVCAWGVEAADLRPLAPGSITEMDQKMLKMAKTRKLEPHFSESESESEPEPESKDPPL